jgi:hypothetical protein
MLVLARLPFSSLGQVNDARRVLLAEQNTQAMVQRHREGGRHVPVGDVIAASPLHEDARAIPFQLYKFSEQCSGAIKPRIELNNHREAPPRWFCDAVMSARANAARQAGAEQNLHNAVVRKTRVFAAFLHERAESAQQDFITA